MSQVLTNIVIYGIIIANFSDVKLLICSTRRRKGCKIIPIHHNLLITQTTAGTEMNKKGITLLELVIVMVIIAIGATLMVPNLGPWIQHYRLRGATRDIISTMRVAQMRAVSQNTQFRVDFTAGTFTLKRNSASSPGGWATEGVANTLPTGITIKDNSFSGANVVFNTDSTASSGTITLKNTRDSEKKITVSSTTGRVTVN
jgi:general secretion pathway protein H